MIALIAGIAVAGAVGYAVGHRAGGRYWRADAVAYRKSAEEARADADHSIKQMAQDAAEVLAADMRYSELKSWIRERGDFHRRQVRPR